MARHLSVESAIDKNRITSSAVWVALLKIEVVDPNTRAVTETLYLARNDEAVLFDGQNYQPANFQINIDQKQGEDPSVSLTAQDHTRHIQSRMEAMAGGVFSEVTLMIVNSERLDQPAELEHTFQVINSSVKNYVVSFTLGAENPLAIAFPKHRQSKERCAWRYKGYGCRYAGAMATCDYTLDGPNGCKAHGNAINFRGLPGLVRINV